MPLIIATWNLENLFRPCGDAGPRTDDVYDAKLAALARTIAATRAGRSGRAGSRPEALADLVTSSV